MPRKVDYPRCSFEDSIKIAKIVDKVGGRAPIGVIADSLGMKESGGGFVAKVNGAAKYGFLKKMGNDMVLTELADKYFHPMDDKEKEEALLQSFKAVPIFNDVLNRSAGKEIDKTMLESMLVRMFDVNRKVASRVAWYFFKANDQLHFLQKGPGGRYIIPEKNTGSQNNTNSVGKTEPQKREKPDFEGDDSISIDYEVFEILIQLGNLLYNKNSDSLTKSVNKIKSLLKNNGEKLSHCSILIDLLTADNNLVIQKLREALIRDLGIIIPKETEEENNDDDKLDEE